MKNQAIKLTAIPRVFALIVFSLLSVACLDEIDLAQGSALPDGIVVQGRINADVENGGADVQVRLERLFQFENSNRPDQVVTATLTLENSEGQTLSLPFRDGAYRATVAPGDAAFQVAPGIGYRLRVQTTEGEEYQSAFDVLPPPLQAESAGASIGLATVDDLNGNPSEELAIFYDITAPVRYSDGSPTFLRWTLEQTYKVTDTPQVGPNRDNPPKPCYVSISFESDELFLFNSLEQSGDRVENFPLAFQLADFRYAEGNVMTIIQEAISRDAYEYFNQVNQIATRDASLFEPPGGPVVGNVIDVNGTTANVFGFFYAANRTVARVAVSPEDAMNPNLFCPLLRSPSPFPQPNSCDDCESLSGSEIVKPDFFPF
ncbi:DUF4249 family protein [Neolewinella agarilytica]|uniref:DUF4249 family protein n=1 Tax=Neolewinella agarilytica TaxID=478744 RepID=UPI002356C883|nr:DUF4249 family protein [Neolewinella agarilytica]